MVQIISPFPSVHVVIELPIPSIQDGWNWGTFSFSLRVVLNTQNLHWLYLKLWLSATWEIQSLQFTVKSLLGRVILSSDVLPWPGKTCSHQWSTLQKRWALAHRHSAFKCSSKLCKIFRCGNQSGEVTRSLCVSVISCGYNNFFLGIFQYFYNK